MVHKKSEYKLQFHILTNDLRKQIWLDNWKFRESCRLTNQAHHYWTYQVTEDPCECDKLTIVEEEKDDAPLPPHRLKHKFLLSIYGSEKSPEKHSLDVADAVNVSRSSKVDQQQVYTADVNQDREDLVPDSSRPVDVFESEVPRDTRYEVATEQLETQPSAPPLPLCSPVPEQPIPAHPVPPAPSPQFRPFQPTSSCRPTSGVVTRGVQRSPDATGRQPSPIRVSFPTPVVDYDAVHRIPPRATTRSRTGCSETAASPSCLARPSRTTRSIFSDEKKQCPFAAFGWNDTNKDVGDKKTYNISAPQTQVYENALRALKKRREEIEKFLAKEAVVRGHLRACDYGVNNSSIWMSEYREKFGGGSKPPVTTMPARNLTSWRCYS